MEKREMFPDLYEKIFKSEDINWDELFLLRVNISYIENLILQIPEQDLLKQQVRKQN
jgi:hypothetical protein